jgi:hypothetical protein
MDDNPMSRVVMDSKNLPPHALAFILDGEVVLIMNTDERSAAIFQSNPTVVEFERTATFSPRTGWKYEDGNFTPPTEGSVN